MNYFLLSFVLFINHNGAEDINSNNSTHWNDSFAVNIGAGYKVGLNQSTSDSPKSTTNINQSPNYLSSILSKETVPNIREPRILTNFTPIVGNPNPRNMKNQFETKNHIVDSRPAASNFGTNNIQNYQVHETFSDEDKYLNAKPSLVDLHNIVNGLEKNKPYSKIVQVIKVPAIYEIHLQSDGNKKSHVNLLPGGFNHNENFNWENHYENKPVFNNLNQNEHLNWRNRYENKPTPNSFNTELLSDDYLKWLNNYYKQREDAFSKGTEKYHKPSPIISHESYVKPEWIDHLQENEFLEPIISHHYRHTQNIDDKYDDKGILVNYGVGGKKKPSTSAWQYKDYFPHRDVNYANGNLKSDTAVKNFNRISSSFSTTSNKFPQNKRLLTENYKKSNLNSKSIKQNQEITEFNRPEAIHEVPAPYLGKHAYPRPFQAPSLSKADTYSKPLSTVHNLQNSLNNGKFNNFVSNVKPQQNIYNIPKFSTLPTTSAQFDKHDGVFPETAYGIASEKNYNYRFHDSLEPETVPTSEEFASYINQNQNLVYGKQTEAVLSPYEINIPVTTQTAPTTFSDNQENMIYKDTHFDYPYHRSSNYDGIYNRNVLQRVSTDQMPDNHFQNKDCIEKTKHYENVPITTHIPDTGSYNNKNQETFNKKSSTNAYGKDNVKDKSQDFMNAESKQNQNSTKRIFDDEYNNYVFRKSPQNTLVDTIKNLSSKIFPKNRYMNNSPLKGNPGKQNNGAHLDYIIYITEKTRHEDDK